jgi:hypothetical protein
MDKGFLPCQSTECSVHSSERGHLLIATTCELPSHELNLFDLQMVESTPELVHQPSVKMVIVFCPGPSISD